MDTAGLRDLKQSEQVQMLLPLMKDRDESQRLLWAGALPPSTGSSKRVVD